MNRTDIIRRHLASAPTESDWTNIPGLDGWQLKVDHGQVTIHVPVVYVDTEHPELGYVDDYSDLPEPSNSGIEEDGSGEWWVFSATDFLPLFTCWDDSGYRVEIQADDLAEAAASYVADGDYGTSNHTTWITIYGFQGTDDTTDDPEIERVKITVDPTAPRCTARAGHDWQAPHDKVGGLKDNPGVFGHGGGVTIHEVCTHCDTRKITDTWAQDPSDGEQGLRSVRYEVPEDVW